MIVSHRQRFVVVAGADKGAEREVDGTRVTIGSAPNNDIPLTDRTVSRNHCEILVRNDRYFLRDLSSTNGTQVNGTPVVEAFLSPGARVQLGDTEIVFEPKKKWERINADDTDHFGELYGTSDSMRTVFALLSKISATELGCVLIGETGTGKELAARALHSNSDRRDKPFVVVDCGAVSATLIESELFGHEKGAFTGADKHRVGAFEAADGGTIFLDEIGELPLELQPKLLRVLERMEIKRLGSSLHESVNVRVVAATHRNLARMIKNGEFREDLYYRLAEAVIQIPPLRDRRSDIPLIAQQVLGTKGTGEVVTVSPEAMEMLKSARWPGNVRELRNVLRRAVAMAQHNQIQPDDLGKLSAETDKPPPPASWPAAPTSQLAAVDRVNARVTVDVEAHLPIKEARERWLAPVEKEYLRRLLHTHEGDVEAAAEAAGIHRKSLERLLRQHDVRTDN